MDLPKNHFKAALLAGQRQIGLWCALSDISALEMLAGCGYDWILLDGEHTTTGPAEAIEFLRAVAPYPVTPVVRVVWNDLPLIKKYLDAGAQTILVPFVQNPAEAEAAVRAVRYAPQGMRGVAGATRASRYGHIENYHARAADEICLLVQVETVEAVAEIEAIAAVEGVDGIFVGPADLAASLGHYGNTSHPEVKALVLDAVRRIRAAGKAPGFLVADHDYVREVAEAGALFVSSDIDYFLLRNAALAARAKWQDV